MKCKNCGKEISETEKFCRFCGAKVEVEESNKKQFCSGCGAEISPSEKYCRKCGTQNQNYESQIGDSVNITEIKDKIKDTVASIDTEGIKDKVKNVNSEQVKAMVKKPRNKAILIAIAAVLIAIPVVVFASKALKKSKEQPSKLDGAYYQAAYLLTATYVQDDGSKKVEIEQHPSDNTLNEAYFFNPEGAFVHVFDRIRVEGTYQTQGDKIVFSYADAYGNPEEAVYTYHMTDEGLQLLEETGLGNLYKKDTGVWAELEGKYQEARKLSEEGKYQEAVDILKSCSSLNYGDAAYLYNECYHKSLVGLVSAEITGIESSDKGGSLCFYIDFYLENKTDQNVVYLYGDLKIENNAGKEIYSHNGANLVAEKENRLPAMSNKDIQYELNTTSSETRELLDCYQNDIVITFKSTSFTLNNSITPIENEDISEYRINSGSSVQTSSEGPEQALQVTEETTEAQNQDSSNIYDAYVDILNKGDVNSYITYDIDNNGIKELFISCGTGAMNYISAYAWDPVNQRAFITTWEDPDGGNWSHVIGNDGFLYAEGHTPGIPKAGYNRIVAENESVHITGDSITEAQVKEHSYLPSDTSGLTQLIVGPYTLPKVREGEIPDIEGYSSSSTSEYMVPGSDSRYITDIDLIGFGAWECKVARNEIYARYGRQFNSQELQDYFNSKSWYQGTTPAASFDDGVLNQYEKENIKTIQNFEKACGFNQ
ncbi:MAG: YARHG domain-containing protein [Lachnospiraceae bacterium]|nr:YARHG domain-containing protein [Lachnospiraceae bacterium]